MVQLSADYATAWDEAESVDKTEAWDRTSADGLDDR